MSFKIDDGLFKLDFTDYHAILGVPINADFKDIRKRYLEIARRLHPDSCVAHDAEQKKQANELLSKLVNPAYAKFSKDTSRAEYVVLLKEMSKRLTQTTAIELNSELSKQLNQTNNIQHLYKTSLQKLAETQYDSFDKVLQVIGQISELNLVYLMRTGNVQLTPPPQNVPTPGSQSPSKPTSPAPPSQPETIVDQYYRRAQALIEKSNFVQARIELQDALKLEPNNSSCHSLMGVVYLKQNQTTMAKVHINKALQLNPKDPMALKAKKFLDQLAQKSGSSLSSKTAQNKQSNDSGSSGLFGGLFGGKKK